MRLFPSAGFRRLAFAGLILGLLAALTPPASAQTGSYALLGPSFHFRETLDGGNNPIPYYIHNDVLNAGLGGAVQSAVQTWVSDPGSYVEFRYMGATSTHAERAQDGLNVIGPDRGEFQDLKAGEAYLQVGTRNGARTDQFDIKLNLDTGVGLAVLPNPGRTDAESIVLHELGHALGLNHVSDTAQIMEAITPADEIARTLGSGDIAGIRHLYPGAGPSDSVVTPPPPPPPAPSASGTCNGVAATISGSAASEIIIGTAGPDVIVAGGGDDIIRAGAGNDIICAGAGRDRVYSGTGTDRVYGGSEIDYIWGEGGVDYLYGEGGSDRLWGGDQNDFLYGDSGADRIYGGNGNDTIAGQGGQDFIWGGAGDDTIGGNWQTDTIRGGSGNDIIRGHGGKDKLFGEAGNDQLFGGENTDTLSGGADNDVLDGGRGTDTLTGDGGIDILNGGKHTDTCNDTGGTTYISC